MRARLSVPREQKENSGGKPRVQVAFFRADFLATGFLCCADFCKRRGRRVCVRENREQNFACCVNNNFPGGNSRDKGFPRVDPGGLARRAFPSAERKKSAPRRKRGYCDWCVSVR